MSDGATDASVTEQEIVFIRFAARGSPKVHFIGVASVEKADTATIYTEIKKVTDEVLGTNQWGEKLVAFGSDGASVMTGVKAGVVAKFRDWRGGHIVGVHCMAHRLELSFKDATKSIALHKKVDTLLLGLFYFYQRSALNRANLKKSYETLQMTPLMPTRVGGTRWTGHLLRALTNFLRGYAAIVQHLQQVRHV